MPRRVSTTSAHSTTQAASDPSRTQVFEELVHYGQLAKRGFPTGIPNSIIIQMEIDAQKKLLIMGNKLKWTPSEMGEIKDALEYWSKSLKEISKK